jgi:DNA-binding response OmpR family regulator
VRAVLRRTSNTPAPKTDTALNFARLHIDPNARAVKVGGQTIILTAKEFDLLLYFAQHPQQVFTRSQLLEFVWGEALYTDPSTVTVHIRRLREKIEPDPSQPKHILTVWGVGYKFVAEE